MGPASELSGELRTLAAKRIEKLTQIGVGTSQHHHMRHVVARGREQDGTTGEFAHQRTGLAQHGGPPEFPGVADQSDADRRDRLGVHAGRKSALDEKTVRADHRDAKHVGAGAKILHERLEHGDSSGSDRGADRAQRKERTGPKSRKYGGLTGFPGLPILHPVKRALMLFSLAAVSGMACGDPNALPLPSFENVEQSVTLYAARGTAINDPSGFSITNRRPVRLDVPVNLDFVFDFDDQGQPVILPIAALGAGTGGVNPGLLLTTTPFDSITIAQTSGFVTADTVPLAVGQIYYMRSRVDQNLCIFGLPFYGKMEVLAIDPVLKAMRFRALINVNCGYRALQPGLPSR